METIIFVAFLIAMMAASPMLGDLARWMRNGGQNKR